MVDLISSARNPTVKRIRLLADRRHRRREGAFVVMGIQPVWQAVEAGVEIETLVLAPELLRSAPAAGMVAAQEAAGVPVARLTGELFARLADRDAPAGLAAIVRARPSALAELPVGPGCLYVALHEVGNPGNLGSVVRTADAAGASGVILVGHTTDPYDPVAVKATMGAVFQLPIAHAATADELFAWAAGRGVTVATTSPAATRDLWTAPCPLPLAYLLGSEGEGLPPGVLARGDVQVRIPILGRAESLNLAVAAGILLYEARRRSTAAR
jgi:TrmH family RNA methyltransferase